MNTKLLMRTSSMFMGLPGIAAIFLQQEILGSAGVQVNAASLIAVQVTGALYFGFAMLNWMAKDNLIGGIYSRPVAIGNLAHFLIAALAIVRVAFTENHSIPVVIAALAYAAFAGDFALVVFHPPAPETPGR